MTYDDIFHSDQPLIVTRFQALTELKKHGVTDFTDFFKEMGNKSAYDAKEVLIWLGY